MEYKNGNGPRAKAFANSRDTKTATSQMALSVGQLLGTPIGMGVSRALEPRVLLDAAGLATFIDAADVQAQQDARTWAETDSENIPDSQPLLEVNTENAEPENPGVEITFIDASVDNLQEIRDAISADTEVIFLDPGQDGVEQMAAALAGRENITAIHIVSHGSSGTLQLGNSTLDTNSINGEYADELAVIREAMADNGDILIYGCDFGADEKGREAVAALANATGADIAASNDLTGAVNLGGDWELEVSTGDIEATAISPLTWAGTLDLTITDAGTAGAIGLAQAILGDGVTINSALYSGTSNQAGTFVTGPGASFGTNILTFTEGAIFSSGTAASIAGPNSSGGFTIDAPGGIDGDADFNALAGGSTFDASFIVIDFTPDVPLGASIGDTGRMTMEIVFGSDEYNEYVYGSVNDTMAVIVNGVNQATVPNGLAIGIDTINDAANFNPASGSVAADPNPEHTSASFESANPSLYVNNAGFNTQMDGFTITIPVTFDVIVGQSNTIKLGIADTADSAFDSWMFIKADSGQTVIVAENDAISTPTNIPVSIDVTANDFDLQGDPLTITHILGQPVNVGDNITLASGVTVLVGAGGNLTITGDGTNTANDAFTYAISDGNGGTSTAFVNVTITAPAVNTPPVAVDDIAATGEDVQLSVPAATGLILSNDIDADGDSMTISAINGIGANVGSQIVLASGALLTVNADGSYDYDPNGAFESLAAGETATDSFNYTISDGNGGTSTATVTLTLNGANDAPVAVADTATTDEDTSISQTAASGLIATNDTDPDTNDTLFVSQVNGLTANVGTQIILPSGALLTVNSDGSYDYNPNGVYAALGTGQSATDSFSYQLSDGNGGTDTASVTITVNGTNDAPVLNLDPDNDNATPGDNTDDGADDGGFEVTFTENGAPVALVDSDVSVVDPEDNIVEMVVTLTNGQIGDTINFPSSLPGNITAAVVPASTLASAGIMTITFTGDASTTNVNWTTVLQSLTFNPSTNDIHNPDPADRNINIQLSDANFTFSPMVTAIVHVVPENDPPTLDLDDDNSSGINAGNYLGTYVENAASLPISDGVLITDLDDANLESVTIILNNGEIGDVLEIGTLPPGITLATTPPTNLLASGTINVTLTGSASLADYQAAIAAITFSNNSDNPVAGIRNITVTGNDGEDDTPTRTAFITVTPVNDPPLPVDPLNPGTPPPDPNNVIPGQSGSDAVPLTPLNGAQYFTDPDDTVLTFSLDPGAPSWIAINSVTGEVTGTPPSDASQNTNNGTAGSYDVIIIATDPGGLTGQTTVVFDIANPAPIAVDDTLSVNEDAANLTGSVFALNGTPTADADPDGDPITVSAVNGASANVTNPTPGSNGGLFTINADGTYVFDQNGAFDDLAVGQTRITTITYQISDGQGGTDTATISLTVTGTNDTPVANDDTASTNEDNAVSINAATGLITPNDTDPDTNDTLVVSQVNGLAANVGTQFALPSGALLTVNADGSYDYDPNGAFESLGVGQTATDSFTYTISDGNGGTDQASVNLTINGVNDAPTANNDTGTTGEDTTLSVNAAAGLITPNDTDPDTNDTLVVSQVNGLPANVGTQFALPSGALLTVNADGSYDYDPNGAFESLAVGQTGSDTFTYTISDGNGGTSTASVTMTINGANDVPVVVDPLNPGTPPPDPDNIIPDVSYSDGQSTLTIDVSQYIVDPDNDPLIFSATGLPPGLAINSATGEITGNIDPNASNGGTDPVSAPGVYHVVITATDINGANISTTVDYSITNVDPVAVDDTAITSEDIQTSGNVITGAGTDSDGAPDADPLFVSEVNGTDANVGQPVTGSAGGNFIINSDGSWTFDPGVDFAGLAQGQSRDTSVTYQLSDGNGGFDTATLTVTVDGVNDAPQVGGPLATVNANDGETISPIDTTTAFSNPDNTPLTYNAIGLPDGLSIDPVTGIISGTLDDSASLAAVYPVSVTATQSGGQMIETTLVINVSNVDPVASGDGVATPANTPVIINALANDLDGAPDSDNLTITQITTSPANGTVTINIDGTLTYTPNGAFTGTDTFSYEVSDGEGGSDVATVNVDVGLGAANAPIASPLTPANLNDGETITPIDIAGSFSDPNGDILTYDAVNLPTGLSIDPVSGLISGILDNDASQNGPYSVLITAKDPAGNQVSEVLTINVTNPLPVAGDDSADIPVNTPVTLASLANDNDPDSDALHIAFINDQPTNGTVVINADSTITYTPDTAFTGTDSFTYILEDANGGRDEATIVVNVGITGPNTPQATPITPATIDEGAPITPIDVSGNFTDPDGDPLAFSATNLPDGLVIDPNTGVITGTPVNDASASGPYTVHITATDPDGNQITSPVIITVNNPAPTATGDSAVTAIDTPVTINVLANDSDPDGDQLTPAPGTSPANGTIVLNSDGTFTYTPDPGYSGSDSFSYTLTDAQGATSIATVTIEVSAAPTIPQALPPLAPINATDGATPPSLDLSTVIIDPDGDPLQWSAIGLPAGLSINAANGQITGTISAAASQGGPNSDGIYTATITGEDTSGDTVSTTITYEINNLAPEARDDAVTHLEDGTATGDVFADNGSGSDGDTPPDSDPIFVSQVNGLTANVGAATTSATGGQFTINADGTYVFDPGTDFQDLDIGESRETSITYQISDGQGGFDNATITVTVTGANDAPVVTDPANPSGNPNEPSVPADPNNIIPDVTANDGEQLTPLNVSPYFVDVDGEQLTFSIDPAGPSAPAWLSIDPVTGIITGTPPANASQGGPASDGVYPIVLVATDPDGETVSTTLDFTILNVPPVVTTPLPDITDTAGYTVNHPSAGSFNDPDGDVLTYTASGLPSGLSIDPQTGEISGTISQNAVSGSPLGDGKYIVTIHVDDGEGGTASSIFVYTILPLPYVAPEGPLAPLAPFEPGDTPAGDEGAANLILTKAVSDIAELGSQTGLFDTTHPITRALYQIDPLSPFNQLGDGKHPISDLVEWIEETRQLLEKSASPDGIYSGGDASSSVGDGEIKARAIVINQSVLIEISGTGFDPHQSQITMTNTDTSPVWLQNVDGRTILILRPADMETAHFTLSGPNGNLQISLDLTTGQISLGDVARQITGSLLFSEQLEMAYQTELEQLQALSRI